MKLRHASTSIAVALLALTSQSHAAPSLCNTGPNLVANCGFETGDFTSWTLSGNDVPFAQDNLYGVEGTDPIDSIAPHSGNDQAFFADLTSNATTLTQTLTTVAGKAYAISFYLAQDTTPDTANPNALVVKFNGLTVGSLTQIPVENYTLLTFFGVANSASTVLSLTLGNGLGEFLLDDVRVTVPEPETLPLMALAALGLGLSTRLRRQKK